MIPGSDEAVINGYDLVKNIIGEGLIRIPEDGFVFTHGRHRIRDIAFSEEIRYESGLPGKLKLLTESLVRLYYEAEEDESFRIPLDSINPSLWPYFGYEDVTGMTLLNFFSYGLVSLFRIRDRYFIRTDETVLTGLPDAEEMLTRMLAKALSFTGEPFYSITVEKSEGRSYATMRVFAGLEITGKKSDDPGHDLTEREQNIRKNYIEDMKRVTEVLDSLDQGVSGPQTTD